MPAELETNDPSRPSSQRESNIPPKRPSSPLVSNRHAKKHKKKKCKKRRKGDESSRMVSDDEDHLRHRKRKRRSNHKDIEEEDFSVQDDNVGHFEGGPGSIIAGRYQVVKQVGLGTFGRVLDCLRLHKGEIDFSEKHVAIKVVRNIERYYESAVIEAQVIEELNRCGDRGRTHCVVLYDAFNFHGHYCMIFERLGLSLYDFLKKNDFVPFPMVCVQDFCIQLLETLEFLHRLRLIHTDLKIENILLINDREIIFDGRRVPESTRIKLIDFGGACYDNEKKSSLINTRQYRAPEVILEAGWSMPSDMWSLGCILAELATGELLFATHDNVEHLALMERVIGRFPHGMLRRSGNDMARKAFDSSGYHRRDRVLSESSDRFVRKTPVLEDLFPRREDDWFISLLRRVLVIDPCERATAHECLQFLSSMRRDRRLPRG